MRLYGKKLIRSSMKNETQRATETRNAILWDILDATERRCRVKVQGSAELITCHYALNLQHNPTWLKPGNAVRILHCGGLRNKVEVIGDGGTIPTAVSGPSGPTPEYAEDSVISGMEIVAMDVGDDRVVVKPGTFRLSDVIYTFPADMEPIEMGDTPLMIMGDGVLMGEDNAGAIVQLTDAPAWAQFRYDILVIGADGVIDVVTGTAATSDPVMPSVPASHVEIGHILRYKHVTPGEDDRVEQSDIYRIWEARAPTNLNVTVEHEIMYWETDYESDIDCEVVDQYDHPYTLSPITFTIDIVSGNGSLYGGSGTTIHRTGQGYGVFTFTYRRDMLITDESPVLNISADMGTFILAVARVIQCELPIAS